MRLPGLLIGLAAGVVHFYALSRFTAAITGGEITSRAVVLGILQFFIPLTVLVLCAFLAHEMLVWTAVGMAAALICGGVAAFAVSIRRSKGRDKKDG